MFRQRAHLSWFTAGWAIYLMVCNPDLTVPQSRSTQQFQSIPDIMNELKYTMLCLLLTGLMCLGPASFIRSQSVQVTVEVESELSGMENDRLFLTQPFYQNIEVEAGVEADENEAILGSYMAGCIAVRSQEN